MKDRFNREINYLRISVTDKCNYNCLYCKPDNDSSYQEKEMLTDNEMLAIITAASHMGVTKIRITGGEPLMRKGLIELIAKINDIQGINEIVMTTNASLLFSQIERLKEAGLSRVNISLDSLDPIKFKYITNGGNLSDVLNSIDKLLKLEMTPVKINVVLMKGFNDNEILDFINLTKDKAIIVRFIELMPIGDHDFSFKKHYLSNEEILKQCPSLIALNENNQETAKYYQLPNSKGKVGFISAVSQHFCASCNRIRITSDGKVKTCLHENKEYDLLDCIRNKNGSIEDYLKECVNQKPKSHKINETDFEKVKRNMYKIGG